MTLIGVPDSGPKSYCSVTSWDHSIFRSRWRGGPPPGRRLQHQRRAVHERAVRQQRPKLGGRSALGRRQAGSCMTALRSFTIPAGRPQSIGSRWSIPASLPRRRLGSRANGCRVQSGGLGLGASQPWEPSSSLTKISASCSASSGPQPATATQAVP